MSKIIVFASFYPKKNKSDEVKQIILAMINPTRAEEGNEIYNFYETKNNDGKKCKKYHSSGSWLVYGITSYVIIRYISKSIQTHYLK